MACGERATETVQADTMRRAGAMRSFGPTGRPFCFLSPDIQCPISYSITRNEVGPTNSWISLGMEGEELCLLDRGHPRRGQSWKPAGWVNETKGKKDTQKQVASFLKKDESLFSSYLTQTVMPCSQTGGKVRLSLRLNECTNSQVKRGSQASQTSFWKDEGRGVIWGEVIYFWIYVSTQYTPHIWPNIQRF